MRPALHKAIASMFSISDNDKEGTVDVGAVGDVDDDGGDVDVVR